MKPGRNDKCPCGSGRKYKRCCIDKDAKGLVFDVNEKEEKFYSKYQTLFDINNELRATVKEMIGGKYTSKDLKHVFTLFMLGKAYKTHGVALSVCKLGYGEDAAILVRTIFDSLIATLYILKDTTEERLQRYLDYDWVIRKQMFDYLSTTDSPVFREFKKREANPKPGDVTTEEVIQKADEMQNKHKYERRYAWSDKSIYGMSKDLGKHDAYSTVYHLQSQYTHTAVRVMNDYLKSDNYGYSVTIEASDNWIEESLIAAFDFLYNLAGAHDKQHELGYAGRLDQIASRWEDEVNKISDKN